MNDAKTWFGFRLLTVAVATQMAFTAFQPTAFAAAETYEIDPAHSSVGFRIKHFFSSVTGRFNDVKGTLTIDPDKVEDAVVDVTIKAASIDTAQEKRDEHLRGADFFDVEKYPELTFKSKSVKRTGDDTADVTGDLNLHGVTKEVTLQVQFLGKGKGMRESYISGWKASGKLNRSDFGITYGALVENVPIIGEEVDLVIDVEANRAGASEEKKAE